MKRQTSEPGHQAIKYNDLASGIGDVATFGDKDYRRNADEPTIQRKHEPIWK